LISTGTYNFTVRWGDGSSDVITAWDQAAVTHQYASTGTYQISIIGTLQGWQFNNGGDRLKILNISEWGPLTLTTNAAFYGCSNMTCTATDAPTIATTSLDSTFRTCSVFNGAIGNWDVSSVTSMIAMLRSCTAFDRSLADWDVSALTTATNFLLNAQISTANYDATLIAWEAQTVIGGVAFHAGNSTYSAGAAATARANLIAVDTWNITDGGPA